MKLKLFDEKAEEERVFDISGWGCMKIGFMSGLGWALVLIVFYILLFVIGIAVGYY